MKFKIRPINNEESKLFNMNYTDDIKIAIILYLRNKKDVILHLDDIVEVISDENIDNKPVFRQVISLKNLILLYFYNNKNKIEELVGYDNIYNGLSVINNLKDCGTFSFECVTNHKFKKYDDNIPINQEIIYEKLSFAEFVNKMVNILDICEITEKMYHMIYRLDKLTILHLLSNLPFNFYFDIIEDKKFLRIVIKKDYI